MICPKSATSFELYIYTMKAKTHAKTKNMLDTLQRGRLEKIKESYGLTELELQFLLSLSSRYQKPSPALDHLLSTH